MSSFFPDFWSFVLVRDAVFRTNRTKFYPNRYWPSTILEKPLFIKTWMWFFQWIDKNRGCKSKKILGNLPFYRWPMCTEWLGSLSKVVQGIYPKELELNLEHNGFHATFFNLNLSIENGKITSKLYHNRDDFPLFEFPQQPVFSMERQCQRLFDPCIKKTNSIINAFYNL